MATATKVTPTPAVKTAPKPVVKKSVKTYSCALVEKNKYELQMAALVAKNATIVTITVNPDMRNSFDVHYYTVS